MNRLRHAMMIVALVSSIVGAGCKVPSNGYRYTTDQTGHVLTIDAAVTNQIRSVWTGPCASQPGLQAVACLHGWFHDTVLFQGSKGTAATAAFNKGVDQDLGNFATVLQTLAGSPGSRNICLSYRPDARIWGFQIGSGGPCIVPGPGLIDVAKVR